jgi:hypothetical protein
MHFGLLYRPDQEITVKSTYFQQDARAVDFLGFGFYPRSGFMHIDLGPARQWGERFPIRETAFAAETPPAREVLADSRTMKGGGAAPVRRRWVLRASRWRRASWPRPNPPSCRWCRISTHLSYDVGRLLRQKGATARHAERLETTEKTHDAQRQMLEAAAHRPRSRDELAERLREGQF